MDTKWQDRQIVDESNIHGQLKSTACIEEWLFLLFVDGRWAVFNSVVEYDDISPTMMLYIFPFNPLEHYAVIDGFVRLGIFTEEEARAMQEEKKQQRQRENNRRERLQFERLKAKYEPVLTPEEK